MKLVFHLFLNFQYYFCDVFIVETVTYMMPRAMLAVLVFGAW
jgi:hypothetical protein